MKRSRLIPMAAITLLLISSPVLSQVAALTDAEEKDKIDERVALAVAKYGAAPSGKEGSVGTLTNFNSFANQSSFILSAQTAQGLAIDLAKLPAQHCARVLVTEDEAVASKILRARSVDDALHLLERRIQKGLGQGAAGPPSIVLMDPTVVVATIAGLVGSVSSIVKLFQSDYETQSTSVTTPKGWVAANILFGIPAAVGDDKSVPRFFSDSLPITGASELAPRVDAVVRDAISLVEKSEAAAENKSDDTKKALDEAKSLLASATKLHTTLFTMDDKGIAPIEAISVYVAAAKSNACIARLIDNSPGAIIMTRDNMLGKGGKVYINTSSQLAAIVTNSRGTPIALSCSQKAASSSIKLSKLTGSGNHYAPMPWQRSITSRASGRCTDALE